MRTSLESRIVHGRTKSDHLDQDLQLLISKYRYTYANGVTHSCQSTTADTWSGGIARKDGQHHGVKFEGADGWIWVTRGNIQASNPDFLTQALPASAERLYVSDDHMGNFFDCVRSRKKTICEPEIGHRSASLCHLGVIAIRLGRKLKWDAAKQEVIGDAEANKWLRRPYRAPWDKELKALGVS